MMRSSAADGSHRNEVRRPSRTYLARSLRGGHGSWPGVVVASTVAAAPDAIAADQGHGVTDIHR